MAVSIEALDREIDQLRQARDRAAADLQNARSQLAAWERALIIDQGNQASPATIANTQAQIAYWRQRVTLLEGVYTQAESNLARKLEFRAAVEQAALNAIARGVDPETAYELAAAEVEAQKNRTLIIYVVAGIIALVGLVALVRFLRKRKKG